MRSMHKIKDTKDKIEDIVDTKVEEEVEDIEDKPKEYIIDEGMYESLLENVISIPRRLLLRYLLKLLISLILGKIRRFIVK